MKVPIRFIADLRTGDTVLSNEPGEIMVERPAPPLVLPTEPGTVIAIGDWWLVLLKAYEDRPGPGPWELLPARNEQQRVSIERAGARQQCVYSHSWVLAEAEQEGGFRIVAVPIPVGTMVGFDTEAEHRIRKEASLATAEQIVDFIGGIRAGRTWQQIRESVKAAFVDSQR